MFFHIYPHCDKQVLLNTWTEGSYSPVHDHPNYSESFVVLDGDLAFFVFNDEGVPVCHILSNSNADATKRAIVVEAGQWHAMTAAPKKLGGSTADASILDFLRLNH